jgi:flagellar assembly protein FliH
LRQTGSAEQSGSAGSIEVFAYPAGPDAYPLPSWEAWEIETVGKAHGSPPGDASHGAKEAGVQTEFEQRLAAETFRAFEAGREQGRAEGRQTERAAQATAQATADQQRARQAAGLIESFAEERDRYLQAVEHEVVELALAIAARILRREAQMDPLLLSGAVRVALGQLSSTTEVRLRVPAAELNLWSETMGLLPRLRLKPKVVSGDGMRLGDCVIETELGSVDLGIRAQLGEIERGFFDRAGGKKANSGPWSDEPGSGSREATS